MTDQNIELEQRLKNDYLKAVSLVKPETADEWINQVGSIQDSCSMGALVVSVKVMQALTEGKSPREAQNLIYGLGITAAMAGFMAQTVTYFHPRGEEFRQHWNKQYMSKEKAERAKDAVNPAILTISPGE